MKDYRLSEIVAHCEKMGGDCEVCEGEDRGINCACQRISSRFTPTFWWKVIEPRDMIELPCKIPMIAINEQVLSWQVAYRSVLGTGDIRTRLFDTEAEADAFLAELKGDKE